MSSPRTTAWISCCKASLPVGLDVDRGLGGRGVGRSDDLDLAVLPLREQEVTLRGTGLVPRERPQDGLDLVAVEVVGELLLVEVANFLHRGLHHLRRGEGIRRVLGRALVVV